MRPLLRTAGLLSWSLAASALVSLNMPARVRACSCVASTLDQGLAGSSAVFEGLVTQVTTLDGEDGQPVSLRAEMKVVRVWKGSQDVEVLHVQTGLDSARCGVSFEPGQGYLVFASDEGGALTTSLCTRTRKMSEAAEDVAALGAGITPVSLADVDTTDEGKSQPVTSPTETAPGAGGCGSCAAAGGLPTAGNLLPLALLAWARRRRARELG